MPLNRIALLNWLVARERAEAGIPLSGRELMPRAAPLCGDDATPWASVARAAGELRSLGCLDWRYVLYPGEAREPQSFLINDRNFQQVEDIMVAPAGYSLFAAQNPAAPATNITITGGQVAFGNITNVNNIFLLLEAAERQIDLIDASEEEKEEARGALRKMREAGVSAASSAAGSVIAAALRQVLGLP
jgi:hypothetical protein